MDVFSLLLMLAVLFGLCYLIFYALSNAAKHLPTWTGIIISALFGLLPLYLILCFFGFMGEKR